MAGDWSLPTNSRAYASVLSDLDSRLVDAFTLASLGNPSNTPTGAKKYDEGNNKFQRWNGSAWVDLVLSIAAGGTGGSSAAGARTSLGLGDMATQDSTAVAITGGTIAGVAANANIITAGLIAQARLGTGSGGTGTQFLADDQTYKIPAGIPIGGGCLWFAVAPPTNFLIMDGTAISRATYAALFAVIGTNYGIGDGSTTFNLPNFQSRIPIGVTVAEFLPTSALGSTFGNLSHTHTGPAHTHTVPALSISSSGVLDIVDSASASSLLGLDSAAPSIAGLFSGSWFSVAMAALGGTPANPGVVGAASHSHGGVTGAGTSGSSGTGATGTANPPCLVVNFIIRYA